MRAMVLNKTGPIASSPLRLEEVAKPAPLAGEVLVKVRCCAICRTDLHVIEGELPPHKRPVIPGHQAVGIVEPFDDDQLFARLQHPRTRHPRLKPRGSHALN